MYDPLVLCVQKSLQQSDEAILDFLPYVKAADIPCSHMVQLYTRLLMQNYRRKLEKRVFLTIFDDQVGVREHFCQQFLMYNILRFYSLILRNG